MKTVHVTQAVGMSLGQDLTKVVPGSFKGPAFRKGHVIRQEDIPAMMDMGKDHVYIIEFGPNDVHENEAARRLARLTAGVNVVGEEPAEGRVNLRTGCFGLLKIDVPTLCKVNEITGVALSTLHTDIVVQSGDLIAGAKIIPLSLPAATLDTIAGLCAGGKVIDVLPLPPRKAGLIVTGNEVFYGRIEDKFAAVIRTKLAELGSQLTKTIIVPDDVQQISSAIHELSFQNDIVMITGGMSVDPDDVTPLAVQKAGAKIAVYGTPVLPGAMFLLASLGQMPVLGSPACGMFSKITILDYLLPKVLLGETITRHDIAALGHGGLCRSCAEGCRYPHCSFCK